jgi:fatty-acid desaturase
MCIVERGAEELGVDTEGHTATAIQIASSETAGPAERALSPGVSADTAPIWLERWIGTSAGVTSLLGPIVAVVVLWWVPIGVTELVLLIVMSVLTGFGIGVGHHRLFSHRSFQTFMPIRVLFAVLGSMAGEGPPLYWAAVHRCHHRYSDRPGDPHSPNLHGPGFLGRVRGIWHVHVGFLFVIHEFKHWSDADSERRPPLTRRARGSPASEATWGR